MPAPFRFVSPPNSIKFLIDNPCDAPLVIYAETFLPALGEAVLTLVSFGMDDVIRGAFRPRKGRSRMHVRKGRKGKRIRARLPEFGNMIGSTIMVDRSFVQRDLSQGVRHLWVVDAAFQKGLLFWLIYDVIDEGIYAWSSLIMQSEFCQAKLAQRLHANGFGGGLLGILSWQALLCPTILYKTTGITWNVSSGRVPAGKYIVVAASSSFNSGSSNNKIQIGIFRPGGFSNPYAVSEQLVAEPGFKAKLVISATIDGPARFTVAWRNDKGSTAGIWAGTFVSQIGL